VLPAETAAQRIAENNLPAGPWFHTDDTEMAISIVCVLKCHGYIDQDALAKRFAGGLSATRNVVTAR